MKGRWSYFKSAFPSTPHPHMSTNMDVLKCSGQRPGTKTLVPGWPGQGSLRQPRAQGLPALKSSSRLLLAAWAGEGLQVPFLLFLLLL